MWIKNTNEATSRLYSAWMAEYLEDEDDEADDGDPAVEQLPGNERGIVFDGAVQVSNEIGKELVERLDDIAEHDSDN